MTALMSSTYSPIPYWFAYWRISGSIRLYLRTTGLTVLELSPPTMQRIPPNSMTIIRINTAIQPPAPIATSKDFVAAMIARTAAMVARTVAFAACCAARAACLAACDDFCAAFADAFTACCAALAVCSVVFTVVRAVRSAVFTSCRKL